MANKTSSIQNMLRIATNTKNVDELLSNTSFSTIYEPNGKNPYKTYKIHKFKRRYVNKW